MATANFDETVEAAFQLGIDPRKADQLVRGTVALPNGTGKTVRVAVFAPADKAKEAQEAGADLVGGKELVAEIGRRARARLRPCHRHTRHDGRGWQAGPHPRSRAGSCLTPKPGPLRQMSARRSSEFKGGRIEYRNDRFGNVQVPVGKASFDESSLVANLAALTAEIMRVKPASAKGRYIKHLVISSTMGPGVKIDVGKIEDLTALAR